MARARRSDQSPWELAGLDGGHPCLGDHRFCKCKPCVAFKRNHNIKGDYNLLLDGDIGSTGKMAQQDKLAWDVNTAKFDDIIIKIREKKEKSGWFWGIFGQPPHCTICDLSDVDDILQKFIQREVSTDDVIDFLKKAAVEKVVDNADELTKETLKEVWLHYMP